MTPGAVAVLLGTRPEAIKLAPVVRALSAAGAPPLLLVTGQHEELLRPVLSDLGLAADENLRVMARDQGLAELSARLLATVDEAMARLRPSLIVVQGDTTSAAMGALAGFYRGVRVAHVEAGLRTGDARNPFPEEMNRRLVGQLADLHFAPTARARDQLLREGVAGERVHLVGNTVVDALQDARARLLPRLPPDPATDALGRERRLVLVTAHRRESFGDDLRAIVAGVRSIARAFPGDVEVAYPVHLNPNVDGPVREMLADEPGVRLLDPLPYLRFLDLLTRSTLVVTDSGGVQEEATALGKPFLVVRRTSERLEAIDAGVGELVGTDAAAIAAAAARLLSDPVLYARRAAPSSVFGDGRAGERIAEVLLREASAETAGRSRPRW
ncbi:MAG: UDP-N-acetylglucosamine 2-epimerase (non-hydrolyzing) [Vicinamibacteria bacterium]